jgi:hypothetical protein
MQRDQDVIDRWRGSAPFWEKQRETIRQVAPVTQALIEDAAKYSFWRSSSWFTSPDKRQQTSALIAVHANRPSSQVSDIPIGAASAANASGLLETVLSKVHRPERPSTPGASSPAHFR